MMIDLTSADVAVLNDALLDAGFKRFEHRDWRDNRITDLSWSREVFVTKGKGAKARKVFDHTEFVFLSLITLGRESAAVAKTAAPIIAPIIDRLLAQARQIEVLNGRW